MKLSNIRLLVNDFEKAFRFYNETLGLTCTWGDKDNVYASFDIGLASGLTLFKSDLMAESIGNKKAISNNTSSDKFAIIIEVQDVDKMVEILEGKSIRFISPAKDMPAWGIRVAHFRDTEDNLIEIISNLPK